MTYLKLDKLSFIAEKTIYAAVYISFFISIPYLTMNFDNYIPTRYDQNWNSKIITDVKFIADNLNCTQGYEDVRLGYWSGFDDGCFCRHSISNETFAFSGKCQDLTEGFSCNKISQIDKIEIRSYLGGKFCVKKTNFTFMDLYMNFTENLKTNQNQLSKMNDKKYNEFKFSDFKKNEAIKSMIPKNILMDFKISEKDFMEKYKGNIFDGKNYINIANYQKDEIKVLGKTINIYTKYYSDIDSFTSIDDLSNLISDVHLYNYIWCAYLDLAFSAKSVNGLQSKSQINHGFEYCDDLIWDNYLFYNDGFKRNTRVSIKENQDISVLDFYTADILNYYNQNPNFKNTNENLKRRIYPENSIEPLIVAERFYDGFGCRNIESLSEHLNKLKTYKSLRTYSIFVLILILFILSIDISTFFLFDKKNETMLNLVKLVIAVLFAIVNFLVLLSYFSSKNAYNYFQTFLNCQNNNYINIYFNSVSAMEESFYYSFKFYYQIAISLWLVSGLGFLSSIVYGIGILFKKMGLCIEKDVLAEQAISNTSLNSVAQE